MNRDHFELLQVAKEMIFENGRKVTFKKVSKIPSDANKPWNGTTQKPEIIATGIGCFVPISGNDFGGLITDINLYKNLENICLTVSDMDISNCNLLEDEYTSYKIDWVQILQPGDLKILFALGINK